MNERKFAVVAEPISTGETRYTVEVNGMTDYPEVLTAEEVRTIIGMLQQVLDENEGKGGEL